MSRGWYVIHTYSGHEDKVSTAPKRMLPDVPIMEDTGITKYEDEIFYGLVAPAKTPQPAIKQVSDLLQAAMKTAEVRAKFAQLGMFMAGNCGASFGEFLRNTVAKYERVIQQAGIKAN